MNQESGSAVEYLREDSELVLSRSATDDGRTHVLRLTPAVERAVPGSLLRLEHEYALRDELDSAWAARPLALVREEQSGFVAGRNQRPAIEPVAARKGQQVVDLGFLAAARPIERARDIARCAGDTVLVGASYPNRDPAPSEAPDDAKAPVVGAEDEGAARLRMRTDRHRRPDRYLGSSALLPDAARPTVPAASVRVRRS